MESSSLKTRELIKTFPNASKFLSRSFRSECNAVPRAIEKSDRDKLYSVPACGVMFALKGQTEREQDKNSSDIKNAGDTTRIWHFISMQRATIIKTETGINHKNKSQRHPSAL